MRGYVSLAWLGNDPTALALVERIRARAAQEGAIDAERSASSWTATFGPARPGVYSPTAGCLVVGEVFEHPREEAAAHCGDSPIEIATWFARTRWGRYVILFRDASSASVSVFRDPSGALAAHVWTRDGVRIVASGTPDWLMEVAAPPIALDWTAVAGFVQSPFDAPRHSGVRGLRTVQPGELLLPSGEAAIVWSAEAIAARPQRDPSLAQRRLRQRLDACVAALGRVGTRTGDRDRIGLEISGGLDSAIVAGAVKAQGLSVRLALNTFADATETDEERFARAVADRAALPLTRRRRTAMVFDAGRFEATAGDPQPSQNGRDLENDQLVADSCWEAGVSRLITGKGGDALFFQMHTPLAFADQMCRRGWLAVGGPLLPGVARWTRTSAWSVIAEARRANAAGHEPIPPAKRMQIAAIAGGLGYYSACRRSAVADMIHPLMSQPLVEWALETPVPLLVAGGRDRWLARETFADRLPPLIAARRGKGDYAAWFNRQVAANLPFLRDYLLDGRLAREGVIDRSGMEERLQADRLRWQGGAAEILAAVSVEAWVRRWEARRARA